MNLLDLKIVAYKGKNCRITKGRIGNRNVKGFWFYELRHGDIWSIPLTVEKHVDVNFWGTLITPMPLWRTLKSVALTPKNEYIDLTIPEQELFMEAVE